MKLKSVLLAATTAVVFGTLSRATLLNAEEVAPATQPATQPTLSANATNALSYSLGARVGASVVEARSQGIELNVDELKKAIDDAIAGRKSPYNDEQMQAAFSEIGTVMAAKEEQARADQMRTLAEQGEKQDAAGKAYRDENAKKEGVKTTESGLQIQMLAEGEGASPKPTDTVKVHYTGTLIDGTKFDSSYDRGQPIEFKLNRVIRGWTEGVGQMKVGGKARLVIPPGLGYGAEGAPPEIPPNATLVFDVELLGITPAEAPAAQPGGM